MPPGAALPFDPLTAFIVAGLLGVIGILWRDHLERDKETRADRDLARTGWKEQTDANARLANAWEARNRRDAAAKRRTDRP